MNAELLEVSADLLLENVKGWEQRTIEVICERIKTLGYISPTDQKALKNIVDFTGDMDGITKDLATTLAMTSKDIEILYKQTLEYTGNQKESLYQYLSISPTPFIDNKKAQAIVRAFMKTTEKSMRNLSMTKALYLTGADGIRKPFEDAYKSILDKAVLAVSTGAGDFQSEMRSTIAQLGGGGVRVNYGSGVTRRLDTVVRQNILYGAKQANIEYDEVIGEELGCDGFEVDYHSSPRPSHGFMGGQMFAIGKARTVKGVYYPSGDVALERLNEYGCLHDKSTVILGVSEPSYSKEELAKFKAQDEELVDIDGVKKTRYEWKQEQRKLETAVRYKKDQANAFKASGDMDGRRQAQGSIDSLTAKYDRLTEKAGLQSTPERMSVAGFNKVKATTKKSTAVVKKSLITGNDSGIIKATPKPKKVEFVPAKTIEEAQEYSKKFIDDKIFAPHFKGEVNFKGIDLEYANEINRSLLEINEQIKLPKLSGIKVVSGKSKQFKSGTDAIMAYSPVEKGIYINKDILKNSKTFANQIKQSDNAWSSVMDNIDKLTGSQKELAQRYKDAGRSLVDGKTVNGLFTHELGHHVQWQVFDVKTTNALAENSAKYATKISGYATANRSEYMAESFVAYMRGETKVIDPLYADYLNKLI